MANKDYRTKSHMPISFHDWLDECPLHWERESHDEHGATYWFKYSQKDE